MKTSFYIYVDSKEIQDLSQLKNILDNGVGIMIDGRIYATLESILEVDYLNCRYDFITNIASKDEDDSDNEVKTLEFERIGKLAYAIRFPNQKS